MKNFKKIIMIVAIVLIILAIGFIIYGYVKKTTEKIQNPVATIEVKDYGTIKVELYPDKAPNTVANFIALANNEFYDGLTFHRVVSGFMIQGGDKLANGKGTPSLSAINKSIEKGSDGDKDYTIKGEFIKNGYADNNIKFEKGVIGMARSDYSSIGLTEEGYNSAGSQFFIMQEDNYNLDGQYAAFGKVIEGIEIVDNIANIEVTEENGTKTSTPVDPPVITSIRVETYGIGYGMPNTQDAFDPDKYVFYGGGY